MSLNATFQTVTHAFYATCAFAIAAAALSDIDANAAAIAELAMVASGLTLVGMIGIYVLAFTAVGRRFDRRVTARVQEAFR
jgi:hypothetical protein